MFQLTVFRGAGALWLATDGSVISGKSSRKPPWSANMPVDTPALNQLGDHCQPPLSSFTSVLPSVERSPIDPVVR